MDFELIRSIRLAVSFLTILPVCPEGKIKNEEFARSITYFSLVGVLLGSANLAILYLAKYLSTITINLDQFLISVQESFAWFFSLGWAEPAQSLIIEFNALNPWLIAALVVFFNNWLTGALHLDGLMDSFDGLACGAKTRKGILEVMKDSRVGAFGSMAGTMVLILKLVFLAQLDYQANFNQLALLLFLLPALSRLMMVLVILFQVKSKSVTAVGSSLAMFKKYQRPILDTAMNIFWIKMAVLIFIRQVEFGFDQLIKLDLIFIPWMIGSWFIYQCLSDKLKGHNGDTMGAGLEITETLALLLLVLLV
ncbi:MAG: adenosylcobinamide-GDP ribazoletransferase [Candidatus Melainabacteria bacterium]|nr:adenosylcobinamide-GDP ribazoletransferase [Candidatus Melainabacteria bacterium]